MKYSLFHSVREKPVKGSKFSMAKTSHKPYKYNYNRGCNVAIGKVQVIDLHVARHIARSEHLGPITTPEITTQTFTRPENITVIFNKTSI